MKTNRDKNQKKNNIVDLNSEVSHKGNHFIMQNNVERGVKRLLKGGVERIVIWETLKGERSSGVTRGSGEAEWREGVGIARTC